MSDKTPKRGMPDGTPEAEYERAMYHGPDTRTVDALRDAIQRYNAAERDFIQVHQNTVKIDEKRIAAERELADCREKLERWKRDELAERSAIHDAAFKAGQESRALAEKIEEQIKDREGYALAAYASKAEWLQILARLRSRSADRDAERYRWLRSMPHGQWPIPSEAAIDYAIEQSSK
jgi:hypothetical protein